MVISKSQNKITEFFMILAWASPFTSLLLGYMSIYVADTKVNIMRLQSAVILKGTCPGLKSLKNR